MENRKRFFWVSGIILVIFMIIVVINSKETIGYAPRDIVYQYLTSKDDISRNKYSEDELAKYDEDFQETIENLSLAIREDKTSFVFEQDVEWNDLNDGDYARVKIYKNNESGIYENKINIFYLKKVGDSFTVDLDPMINDNETTLDQFIVEKNNKSKMFKVYAKLDSYNNLSHFKVSKKIENNEKLYDEEINKGKISSSDLELIDKYYSVTLKDPENELEIQGFVEKGDIEGEYLSRYLSGDGFKQITVELSNLELENVNEMVKIDSIKSLNWADMKYNK